MRGGRAPRIKRLSEYIGESYFDYLANLDDLVLLMDESHRYRASAGVRAINELKPILGLELTATPFTEIGEGPGPLQERRLPTTRWRARWTTASSRSRPSSPGRTSTRPACRRRRSSASSSKTASASTRTSKVELDTYARESGRALVKPFVLVIARDTTHAAELDALIKSDAFFDGRYKDRVIQVDSSKTGRGGRGMVERLLRVEQRDEPTEIVIHVNMLKEGWDVTNLYTIVPLRAANARTLVEQSIGRGLRLPYGERTGITAVDRAEHRRARPLSGDRGRREQAGLALYGFAPSRLRPRTWSARSSPSSRTPILADRLGAGATVPTGRGGSGCRAAALRDRPEERSVAQVAMQAIEALSAQPRALPGAASPSPPTCRRPSCERSQEK